MKRIARPVPAILAFCSLGIAAGCRDVSPNLVGSYAGKLEMPPQLVDSPLKRAAVGRLLTEKATLQLNPDKTFAMHLGGEMTGNWSVQGGKIRLDMVSIEGRTIEDEIKRSKLVNPGLDEEAVRRRAKEETYLLLDYSDDFKTVIFRDKQNPQVKVLFRRVGPDQGAPQAAK